MVELSGVYSLSYVSFIPPHPSYTTTDDKLSDRAVYELAYPRQDSINWHYVAEKVMAVFGVLGIMIVVSQHYMWPVVMRANQMSDLPVGERLKEIPWVFMDLLFPFLVEYLVRVIGPLCIFTIQNQLINNGTLDDMVSHLGINLQSFGGAHSLRGSRVLWQLVE